MKRSFNSWTDALFWSARTSTIGTRTSDVLVFIAHLSPYCSVESRVLECFLHTLRMILPCSCLHGVLRQFQVFSEISRYFTLRTRLRCFDGRLDTNMEPSPSTPSHPREPRKAQRPSDISKIHSETEIKAFNNQFGWMKAPFDRMELYSGEWLIASGEWT